MTTDEADEPPLHWRETWPIHEAADLFPMMGDDDLDQLADDIDANGLQQPIVLWKDADGNLLLLDGRNRLAAAKRAGIDTRTLPKPRILGPETDPVLFVISANVHRRHLTSEQKRDLVADLIHRSPEMSDRQLAKVAHVSPTFTGNVRKEEEEEQGNVSATATRTDSQGRQQPATKRERRPNVTTVKKVLATVHDAAILIGSLDTAGDTNALLMKVIHDEDDLQREARSHLADDVNAISGFRRRYDRMRKKYQPSSP